MTESPGLGVDSEGNPVVDPTKNVLSLVEASVRRQDDLRELTATHLETMANLREQHAKDMATKETQRLDAVRAVDVAAVSRAADVAALQAATLAAQVATSAETLRGQVAAAASAASTSLTAALEPILKNIDDLRRSQYELQGQRVATTEGRTVNQWVIALIVGIVVTICTSVFSAGVGVALYFATHQ
jgi:hypothetical protein